MFFSAASRRASVSASERVSLSTLDFDMQSAPKLPDELASLAGRLIMAWGAIDHDLENMMNMILAVGACAQQEREGTARVYQIELENRFTHRLKLYRRGIAAFYGEGTSETREIDAAFNSMRQLEPLRAAIAHGKVVEVDQKAKTVRIRHITSITANSRTSTETTISAWDMCQAIATLEGAHAAILHLEQGSTNWLLDKIRKTVPAKNSANSEVDTTSDQPSTSSDASQSLARK